MDFIKGKLWIEQSSDEIFVFSEIDFRKFCGEIGRKNFLSNFIKRNCRVIVFRVVLVGSMSYNRSWKIGDGFVVSDKKIINDFLLFYL